MRDQPKGWLKKTEHDYILFSEINWKNSQTYPYGNTTIFDYNGVGNLIKQTDPLGHFRTMTYDMNRNLASIIDEDGRTMSFEYDAANRQTAVVAPGGARSSTQYDSMGRVKSLTDPMGAVTRYEYDQDGQLIAEIDALVGRISYEYDTVGNLLKLVDAKGNANSFTYDKNNHLLSETDPLNRSFLYGYDADGNIVHLTDAKNQVIYFTYDANKRLSSRKFPDNTTETYEYDLNGNLVRVTNPDVVMSYAYDKRDLLTQATNQTINQTISYSYDAKGQKVSLTYPDNEIISYARDKAGNVITLSSSIPGEATNPLLTYSYTPAGLLAAIDYSNGMHVARPYNNSGQLTVLRYTKRDNSVISEFSYAYNARGDVYNKTTDLGSIQYGYSSTGSLTSAQYSWKSPESFTYDLNGNRTASVVFSDWRYDEANQLISFGSNQQAAFSFTYDENGMMNSKVDAISSNVTNYFYTYNRTLKEVKQNGLTVAKYKYDPFSLRIKKEIFSNGSPASEAWYTYGTEGILAEHDASGTVHRKYIWNPDRPWGSDPVIERETTGEYLFYINDHLMTPQKIVDSSLNTVSSFDRAAFGETSSQASSTLCFPGQYFDRETGLSYNRLRYYDPSLGRYLESDPIRFTGGLNLYIYGLNNPVNYIDQLGLKPTRESGASMLRGALSIMEELCNCCVEKSLTGVCKQDAKIIRDGWVELWLSKFGTGPYREDKVSVGGYLCGYWATEFLKTVKNVHSEIWDSNFRRFIATTNGMGQTPIHWAVRVYIKKANNRDCNISVDDGFFEDGIVHDKPNWPTRKDYKEKPGIFIPGSSSR